MSLVLVFGNKNYSSWSLRPWLLLRHFELPFTEKRLSLFTDEARAVLKPLTPTGCVPVLLDQQLAIWDSLAICEYVSEQYLQGRAWPASTEHRARARSLAAEMHSGFQGLRSQWPMNVRLQRMMPVSGVLQANIQRIDQMWNECLQQHGGPWLFGNFSIADAMYAPIVLRFYSYQPDLSTLAQQYLNTMLAHTALQEWMAAGRAETEVIDEDEIDYLAQQTT